MENAIYQNNALFPFAWEGFTEGKPDIFEKLREGPESENRK